MNLTKTLTLINCCLIIISSCTSSATQESITVDSNAMSRIAIGSCSRQDNPDQMWKEVINENPDLWIWTGDIVYGDTHDMELLASKYETQKNNTGYQQLISQVPVIGIWDDHDYGINDGGKAFSKKKESKAVLMNFLDVPADNPVWDHQGAYNAYTYGEGNKKVKVILLDARYFRDTVMRTQNPRQYVPNPEGDILGEEQWTWLEDQLTDSDAAIHILASGIQVIAEDHVYEKWSNFPKSRARILDLIETTKPKNTFFISGDRHISELSKLDLEGIEYPLFDFTSSGLTHTWGSADEEINRHRVGELIIQKSYGVINIDWSKNDPKVTFEIKGKNNELFSSHSHQF